MPKNKKASPGSATPRRQGRERRVSVRSELRKQPDVERIAKVVVALAMAQAEKEAEEQARREESSR